MSNDEIRNLLAKLHEALRTTKADAETRGLAEELESDIDQLLSPDDPMDTDSVLDKAKLMETQFAANHPLAERFFREIVEALGRMGV